MTKPQTFIVYWSRGPMDNPDCGDMEVKARSVEEASRLAEITGLQPTEIDAVMTKTFQDDMEQSAPNPPSAPTEEQYDQTYHKLFNFDWSGFPLSGKIAPEELHKLCAALLARNHGGKGT